MDNEIEIAISKIESAMVNPDHHADSQRQWLEGFNTGLDWATRILRKDKSAY